MAVARRKCWLTFEGACQDRPCLWMLARKHPDVSFDIRHATVHGDLGVMAVMFEGDEDEVNEAFAYLQSLGVRVDPVEGGSLVAG